MRLQANRWFSTEVPIHTHGGQELPHGTIAAAFSMRLVSSCQCSHGVASMTSHSRLRASVTCGWSSNTSAIDAQNTLAGIPARAASRFHFSGRAQLPSDSIRRGPFLRHTWWP
jgi:hypothetical protein